MKYPQWLRVALFKRGPRLWEWRLLESDHVISSGFADNHIPARKAGRAALLAKRASLPKRWHEKNLPGKYKPDWENILLGSHKRKNTT